MPTILRRLSLPLLQVGDLAFDAEVSVQRGGEREISERRLAAGASVGDHSRRPPRVYEVEGIVSALAQPQNLGRPGSSFLNEVTSVAQDILGSLVPLEEATRLQDFEARLDALLNDDQFGELELISKVVGRVRVVLLRWDATAPGEGQDGAAARYRMTFRAVQRAGLTIALATEQSLEFVGSGGAPQPGGGGPSQSTPGFLEVTP